MRKIKLRGITEDNRIVYGGFSVHATDGKIVQDKNELALTGKVAEYEQSTGLSDDNGKEIYNGDIEKNNGVCVFFEGCFYFKKRKEGHTWDTLTPVCNVVNEEIEITGNIHKDGK